MRHIQGSDRAQTLLLPASVEDYVGADNPVRVIEAFVDGFDLLKAGFVRAEAKDTGRPGYHPGDLLKLYLYDYLNRIRSSRRLLEAECHRNLEVIWLLRGLRPDFKTVADFPTRGTLRPSRRPFVTSCVLCRKLDLFGQVSCWRWTARASKPSTARSATSRAEKLKTMLQQRRRPAGRVPRPSWRKRTIRMPALRAGMSPVREPGREDRHAAKASRTSTPPSRRNWSARARARCRSPTRTAAPWRPIPKVGVGYNAQVAVDAKHQLIVEQEVTNLGSDLGQLAPTAIPAKEDPGRGDDPGDRRPGLLCKGEDIAACAAAGIVAFVPKPLGRGAAASNGRFPKEAFVYDAAAGRVPLSRTGRPCHLQGASTTRGHRLLLYYHPTACRRCPLRAQCTSNPRWRRISRWEGEAVLGRDGGAAGGQPADDPCYAATRSNIPLARSSTP